MAQQKPTAKPVVKSEIKPVAKPELTEAQLDRQIAREKKETEKIINGQQLVTVVIQSERDKWRGMINGIRYEYPANTQIQVPESVAAMIEDNARAAREADARIKRLVEKSTKVAEF